MNTMSEQKLMELAHQAIIANPEMVLVVRPKYVTETDWEYAISAQPRLFKECKTKTFSICLAALSIDGMNLEYINPMKYSGSQYAAMCQLAVQTTPKAYLLVPKNFQTEELKAKAMSNDPELLINAEYLSTSAIKSMLDVNPSFIKRFVNPSDDILIYALSKDPRVIVYFPHISPAVKDFFEEHFPQYASMLHDA